MGVNIEKLSFQKLDTVSGWELIQSQVKILGQNSQIFEAKKQGKKALVKFPLSQKNSLKSFFREKEFLEKIKISKNISHLIESGVEENSQLPYLILENHGKTFADKLYLEKEFLTVKSVKNFLRKIRLLLMDVHSLGYVHGDIKTENICYRSDQDFILIDWGNSFKLNERRFLGSLSHHHPPYKYWIPEVDIYGLAVLAFQLLFQGEFLECFFSREIEKVEPYLSLPFSTKKKVLQTIYNITDWSEKSSWKKGERLWGKS